MSDKQDKKVLPIDKWRQDRVDGVDIEGNSLGPLLEHMRKVRETVPVNTQLKEELRKKLFQQHDNDSKIPEGRPKPSTGLFNRWFCVSGLAIALIVIGFILWQQVGFDKKLVIMGGVQEVTRYWAEEEPLKPAVSPDGKDLLITRGGALLWLDQSGAQFTLLKPQPGEQYHSPTWTPDGKKITLVMKTKEGIENIIQYQAALLNKDTEGTNFSPERIVIEKSEVLYRGQEGEEITNLHWSPRGNYLAYTLKQPRKESTVWLLESGKKPISLGAGTDFTWSPDSTRLVVLRQQKESQLWLVSLNQQEELLGNGENPVWSSQGYLVYTDIKSQERILTYMPDGSPQFTVQQQVGEIRSVYMGGNGQETLKQLKGGQTLAAQSSLLISLNSERSLTELEWLRQLEIDGVREPRVLLLDEVEQNISRCFGPQGQSLFLTKESGGMVAISRVELEERIERRGDQ